MKLLGAILVVVGTGAGGVLMAHAYQERIHHLEQLIRGLNLLAVEIGYGMTPLEGAFRRVAKTMDNGMGPFFATVTSRLQEKGSASEAWRSVINEFRPKMALVDRDWLVVEELTEMLGTTDQERQVKAVRSVVERLQERVAEAQTKAKTNERILRYSGFAVGMILVLILY
jgi:stage III sporulation protein AB